MSRLTTRMRADAMIRRAQSEGGFGVVLAHGDDSAGSLILVIAYRDGAQAALQRTLGTAGYAWSEAARQARDEQGIIDEWLSRQRKYDPDLWAIELSVADPERFIAESVHDD